MSDFNRGSGSVVPHAKAFALVPYVLGTDNYVLNISRKPLSEKVSTKPLAVIRQNEKNQM